MSDAKKRPSRSKAAIAARQAEKAAQEQTLSAPEAGSVGPISVLRRVDVNRGERDLTYFDKDGSERPLGRIMADAFSGEGIQKFSFLPDETSPFATTKKNQEFRLGVASDSFQAVNPRDAQQVLMDRGFVLKDIFGVYGGTELTFVYLNPDSRLEDAIGYDVEKWGMIRHGDPEPERYVSHTVRLNVSMVIGKMGARYSSGIWRLVCTNLAVSKVLGLPEITFTHTQWGPKLAQEMIDEEDVLGGLNQVPMGPRVATSGSLDKTLQVLRDYQIEGRTGEKSERYAYLEKQFTPFKKDYMSSEILSNYIDHLSLLVQTKMDQGTRTPIHALELVNAYTSAVSEKRYDQKTDRGTWVAYNQVDPVVQATTRLAQMAEIFVN